MDDLIDYATKMRKVMYKRIFLIRNYQALIRNDRRFKERAKDLTRSVVKWSDEEKKNVPLRYSFFFSLILALSLNLKEFDCENFWNCS